MDELIGAMATSQVSTEPNSISAPHPRFALYKVKGNEVPQEVRRRRFLEAQKKKRFDFVAHARCLATNTWSDDDENNTKEENEETDDMEWECKPKKPPREYKDQLMLSEWLVEVPPDIATEWLLKLCPVGKRSLIVASMGQTKAYTKSGYLVNRFPSHLPGGNRKQRHQNSGSQSSAYSILDCIYNEVDKTYYVLDVMCWNSHPLFDSETEFRFYWLDSKIKENPQVQEVSSANPYKFVALPFYRCDSQSLREALWGELPFPCKLDGLLFYHQRTHYTSGSTPLVGWLKAYMIPEMLEVEVPTILCADKPLNYTSLPEHVSEFYKKYQQRKEADKISMQYECDDD